MKMTAVVAEPLQTTWFVMLLTTGVGLTVMVKLIGVPVQVTVVPVYDGVTVMVAVEGVAPVFSAVNEAILPVPLAARPMEGFVLVHEYIAPATLPLKVMAEVEPPLHTTWLPTAFTTGVGFTVMVNITGVPVQVVPPPVPVGVTVMVATTGAEPVLVAVNVPILPVPLAARPIDGCVFVQL